MMTKKWFNYGLWITVAIAIIITYAAPDWVVGGFPHP